MGHHPLEEDPADGVQASKAHLPSRPQVRMTNATLLRSRMQPSPKLPLPLWGIQPVRRFTRRVRDRVSLLAYNRQLMNGPAQGGDVGADDRFCPTHAPF